MVTETCEQVLSLDIEDGEYHHRIQRGTRVVYVVLKHTALVPPDDRTDSYRILQKLRQIPTWADQTWTTLVATKANDNSIESRLDEFRPHALDATVIENRPFPLFNLLSLSKTDRISDRLCRVATTQQSSLAICKIARFGWELRYIEREIQALTHLMAKDFVLMPTFLGHVFEGKQDRVFGFLMEEIVGRHPEPSDLHACETSLRLLHGTGVVHGDLNRYNIIVTEDGVAKFIDFEAASTLKWSERLAIDEMRNLAQSLADPTGLGQERPS